MISPEGCASILWRSAAQSAEAAAALRLTAQDLKEFKVIDAIVGEPYGGAHRRREETIDLVGDAVEQSLHEVRASTVPRCWRAGGRSFSTSASLCSDEPTRS